MKIGEETSDREYEKRAVKEREIEREKRVHTRSGKARKTHGRREHVQEN